MPLLCACVTPSTSLPGVDIWLHKENGRGKKRKKKKKKKKKREREREDADVSKLLKQKGGNDHRGEAHVVSETF